MKLYFAFLKKKLNDNV